MSTFISSGSSLSYLSDTSRNTPPSSVFSLSFLYHLPFGGKTSGEFTDGFNQDSVTIAIFACDDSMMLLSCAGLPGDFID